MYTFLVIFALVFIAYYASKVPLGVGAWIEQRLPIGAFLYEHLAKYPAPKNLNMWYAFGALAIVSCLVQYVSGIWLVMYYTPTADEAFQSVQMIMREVPYGWLIRYIHATGASMWFLVIYLHIFRSLMYGSYQGPRELLWLSGIALLLLLMAEAYTGYVLPWGQMSYWASKVILSLFSAIPVVGDSIVVWLQGSYEVSTATLHRFFAFHVVGFSFLLLGTIVLHIVLLHVAGSNNPDGVDILKVRDKHGWPRDAIGYYPYFVKKYIPVVMLYFLALMIIVLYFPTSTGLIFEAENFAQANPLVTPPHIRPAWYLSPYYAILRAIPDKGLGALMMLLSIVLWALLPWLDYSPVKSMRYRSWLDRMLLTSVVVAFIVLGVLGSLPAVGYYLVAARIATGVYFAYFLLLPVVSSMGGHSRVPRRIP